MQQNNGMRSFSHVASILCKSMTVKRSVNCVKKVERESYGLLSSYVPKVAIK